MLSKIKKERISKIAMPVLAVAVVLILLLNFWSLFILF
ncbi:hypothetical protein GILI108418_02580 [Gillisia limnaea]|uniref:Uncharacterized protein n=1 Tax=Gillisia limnaea (strain DSM 15749 / LMG 21470 / R-8282) TaxID=865937 RepID=H2BX63_GILLR|nr:hypothetical protein Gilli_2427 [Gillisia limnaea DSM 15749]